MKVIQVTTTVELLYCRTIERLSEKVCRKFRVMLYTLRDRRTSACYLGRHECVSSKNKDYTKMNERTGSQVRRPGV